MKTLIGLFFLSLAVVLAFACKSKNADNYGGRGDGVWQGMFHTNHRSTTPKGSPVNSYNDIPTADLPLYDAGADSIFEIASRVYGYGVGLTHSFSTINLHPASPKCENPGFVIPTSSQPLWPDGWDNDPHGFDKDPRVGKTLLCAAGMQWGNGYVAAVGRSIAFEIARNELEHVLLANNDPERWESTSGVHQHPLLPDPATAKVTSIDNRSIDGIAADASANNKLIFTTLDLSSSAETSDGLRVETRSVCVALTK